MNRLPLAAPASAESQVFLLRLFRLLSVQVFPRLFQALRAVMEAEAVPPAEEEVAAEEERDNECLIMATLYTYKDKNIHKTWFLMAGFLAFVILVAWGFSQIYGNPGRSEERRVGKEC